MDNKLEERNGSETLKIYASLVWHWAWLLILCTLLAGGTVYWQSRKQTPVYEASTTISIDVALTSQTITNTTLTTSEELATTYAQEMVMQPMLDGVAKRLGLADFPATASVQVTPIQETQLLNVVVQDTDPKQAALLANTLVLVFSDKIQADQASRYADTKKSIQTQMATLDRNIQTATSAVTAMNQQIQETTNALTEINNKIQLDTTQLPTASPEVVDADKNTRDQLQITLVQYQSQLAQLQTTQSQYQQSDNNLYQSYQDILLAEAQSSSGVIQQNPAVPPRSPISPRPVRDALLAAVTGLLIATFSVFLFEFLDDTIRDPEEITRKWGVPVLGMIISYEHEENSLITLEHPRSPITEAFRSLRTNLNFASFNSLSHTILITSSSPEDGKTTVAANLANVIAQSGRTVVVVDADLRRPRIHKVFQMSNRSGLSDQFIHPEDRFDGSLKQSEVTGLQVLTSGSVPPNPAELLGSEKMIQILKQLSNQFDVTILDTPPVLLVTDALVLAPLVGGVILIVKPAITKRAALKNAFEQMKQVKANVIGVVLNDVKINRSHYYHYPGYAYGKKYYKGYHYTETMDEASQKPNAALPSQEGEKVKSPDNIENIPEENN